MIKKNKEVCDKCMMRQFEEQCPTDESRINNYHYFKRWKRELYYYQEICSDCDYKMELMVMNDELQKHMV